MIIEALVVLLAASSQAVQATKPAEPTPAAAPAERKGMSIPPDGTTELHLGVRAGDVPFVRGQIARGANVNAKNEYGATPMSEAALVADVAILRVLLDAGADVESANADGQTALMVVARSGRVEAATLLLARGAKVNAVEGWRGQTALMWAAAQSHPEMVRLLIASGADVNARSQVNDWARQVTAEPRAVYRPAGGLTPLMYAAREGCVDCARALLEAGAELNLPDPEGLSPLLMAILNQRYDVAALLIDKGADPNAFDFWGRGPLYAAADLNTLPRGGRPDRPSLDRTTALEIAERLLAKGADPNMQLKLPPPFRNVGNDRGLDGMLGTGTTPLLRAAKALDAPMVGLLLKHRADLSLTNNRGITPTLAAAGTGSVDADTRGFYLTDDVERRSIAALTLLLDAGGDVNGKESRGLTALHEAARWGWNDVVQFLVSRGADLTAKDGRGNTPVESALGKAGGNSRGGARIDVHEDTAALLRKLISEKSRP